VRCICGGPLRDEPEGDGFLPSMSGNGVLPGVDSPPSQGDFDSELRTSTFVPADDRQTFTGNQTNTLLF